MTSAEIKAAAYDYAANLVQAWSCQCEAVDDPTDAEQEEIEAWMRFIARSLRKKAEQISEEFS